MNETPYIDPCQRESPHQWNVWAVTGFRAMMHLVGAYVDYGPPMDRSVIDDLVRYRNQLNAIIARGEQRLQHDNPQQRSQIATVISGSLTSDGVD